MVASSVDLVTFPWLVNSTTIRQGSHSVQTATRLSEYSLLYMMVSKLQMQISVKDHTGVFVN